MIRVGITSGARVLHAARIAVCASAWLGLGGCAEEPAQARGPTDIPPPVSTDTTYREFGDYQLHFNALTTDQLTPEIARQYNVVRSGNRAMLNVSIIRRTGAGPGTPVAGTVSASAVNLTGQMKNLELREVREGDAVYYIGDVPVADGETLMFTVDATPAGESGPFSVRFSRQFFGD